MTAEQLLARAGNGRAELVRGELVELSPAGLLHSILVGRLVSWLGVFKQRLGIARTQLGEAAGEAGCSTFQKGSTHV